MRRKLVILALFLASMFGVVGAIPGTPAPVASAQPGCVDLGWRQGSYHVFHGVRCGNHDTWEFYGPGGAFGGTALHYWWPSWMTHSTTAQGPGNYWRMYFDDLQGGNHNFHWNWANAAPGFHYKGFSNNKGFAGDLWVNSGIVQVITVSSGGVAQHSELWMT